MQRIIDDLKTKGLRFEDEDAARDYLTYNTTWGMIRKSINLSNRPNNYTNFTFNEIKELAKIEYYYKRASIILVNTLEHQLKVAINAEYQSMDDLQRNNYNQEVCQNVKRNINKFKYNVSVKNKFGDFMKFQNDLNSNIEVYELFDVLYFSDLLEIYNKLEDYGNVEPITKSITELRNTVYHHDEVLRYAKTKARHKHMNFQKSFQKVFCGIMTLEDSCLSETYRTLMNKKCKNTLMLEHISALKSVYLLLSKSNSTNSIKYKVLDEYYMEIESAYRHIQNLTNVQLWLVAQTEFILDKKTVLYNEVDL